MRTVALLMLMFAGAVASFGQTTRWYTGADTLVATTTWQSFAKTNPYERIIGFSLDNDGLVSVYVAVNTDTAEGRRVMLRSGEGMTWSGLAVERLWIKALTGSSGCRLRYW